MDVASRAVLSIDDRVLAHVSEGALLHGRDGRHHLRDIGRESGDLYLSVYPLPSRIILAQQSYTKYITNI